MIVEIYKIKGVNIWPILGELNNEIRDILEKKFAKADSEAKAAAMKESDLSFSKVPEIRNNPIVISNIDDYIEFLGRDNIKDKSKALKHINKLNDMDLYPYLDLLLSTLSQGWHDIVEVNDYPIEFVSEYLSLISKICFNSDLLHNIAYDSISKLIYELLSTLLPTNATKVSSLLPWRACTRQHVYASEIARWCRY